MSLSSASYKYMNKVNYEVREDGLGRKLLEVLSGLMILFFMGVVLWQITDAKPASQLPESTSPPVEALTSSEFQDELEELVRIEIGQPIEGYEPEMFMQVLPGLLAEDFNGVEAQIGVYKYLNGELKHEIPQGVIVHSAASAITVKGVETLLVNIVERLSLNPNTATAQEVLSNLSKKDNGYSGQDKPKPDTSKPAACTMDAKICSDGSTVGRSGPNCEFTGCPVEEEFPIRYGEDASKIEEYRSDCENKMGVFDGCASACGPDAEMCMDVCSMVCTGPASGYVPPTGKDVLECSPSSKLVQNCTMEYDPVCASTVVNCIKAPCPPIQKTYGNDCSACAAGADTYKVGECEDLNQI